MNRFNVFLIFGCVTLTEHLISGEFFTDQKFGEQKFADKTVRNDVWGPNAGYQTMRATGGSTWCVDCSHGSSGGIKSYPHTGHMVKKPLSALKTISSTFEAHVTAQSGVLAYSFTYDIWLQEHKYEVMIWLDYKGQVGPLGAMQEDNVNRGGYMWKVYKGTNGANDVFSFLNIGKTEKGTVDLKDILNYINEKKWFHEGPAVILDEIQLGFEITSTPIKTEFCLKAFTVTIT